MPPEFDCPQISWSYVSIAFRLVGIRKGFDQLVDLIGHITSLADQSFVALDLETTGLDTQRDEIIEIGAVKFQGGQILGSFNTLVNPHRSLSQFVNQLTGITDRDLSGAIWSILLAMHHL